MLDRGIMYTVPLMKQWELGLGQPSDLCPAPPVSVSPATVIASFVNDDDLFIRMPSTIFSFEPFSSRPPKPPTWPRRLVLMSGDTWRSGGVRYPRSCGDRGNDSGPGCPAEASPACDMGHQHETCRGTERAVAAMEFVRLWGHAVDGIVWPGWLHHFTEREVEGVYFVARHRLIEWSPPPERFECKVSGCRGSCGAALRPTPEGLDLLATVESMRAKRAL